ncbi:MAG: methionine--tRNA ligase [Endomicrobium sp.]|jgi:methionyl-tRNA synthetase|nr:methionine--tRNA ligase [Endomicrobium sp.]
MKIKFYITTPIYYVNDVAHIGHSYTTITADIIARWKRLNNFDVFFVTGTDEHGEKIVSAAKKKGQTPLALCDEMSEKFKKIWNLLNISYTNFIRTTEKRHFIAVEKIVQTLFDKGFIFKKKYEGLYCTGCERFYSKKDLDKTGCCFFHKTKPLLQFEENYFFKLSAFQNLILDRITDPYHKEHIEILPKERKNEIIGKLKIGLEDISLSRSIVKWGIPLPFDKEQTAYVWIDALINYVTGLGYPEDINKFQKYWPADIQLMAKDILWFHAVIWPAILIGVELSPPKRIYAHGFFTLNGNKMSKSLSNVISPQELIDKYGVDATRYIVSTIIPFDSDGDISWHELTLKYNVDLANNLGNMISRIIKMAAKYFNLKTPHKINNLDLELVKKISKLLKVSFIINMNNIQLHKAAQSLQNAITFINKQIEYDTPWKIAKTDTSKLAHHIFSYLQAIDVIALYLLPFMPISAKKIWCATGANGNIDEVAKKYFKDFIIPQDGFSISGSQLQNMENLFLRIV